jgi:hypothetical protein
MNPVTKVHQAACLYGHSAVGCLSNNDVYFNLPLKYSQHVNYINHLFLYIHIYCEYSYKYIYIYKYKYINI